MNEGAELGEVETRTLAPFEVDSPSSVRHADVLHSCAAPAHLRGDEEDLSLLRGFLIEHTWVRLRYHVRKE
jgi:uncharacterized heparinase superfamily protein